MNNCGRRVLYQRLKPQEHSPRTRPLSQVAVGPPRTSTRIPTSSAGWLTRRPIRRETSPNVEEFANNATQQGREAGERIQEVAGNVRGAVDKSIKDQPIATLAVAAVAGFVLGALWKS